MPGNPGRFSQNINERFITGKESLAIARAVFEKGGQFRIRASGRSMTPFIRDGDMIVSEPLRNPPGLGEVVLFAGCDGDRLVVHRIIARRGNSYLIRGDSISAIDDGLIESERIYGRVIFVERMGKTIHWGFGYERFIIVWYIHLLHFANRVFLRIKKRFTQED